MIKELENIEKLLYEDENFKKLKGLVTNTSRSLFHIIGKEYDELTFSRVLKYFLDPNEDHNLGEFFLREFIHSFIKNNSNVLKERAINRLALETIDLRRAKVYREYSIGKFGRLDILIEIPNQLLMIIECKMLSSEGDEQTNRYTQWINEERKDNIPLLNCFLTPDGSDPESKAFLPFSYKDVYELFNAKFIQENLTDEKIYLVNNFKKWKKEFMGQDKSITELCRKLYSKYKLEFDLIYSSMPTLKSFYAELAESINKQFSNNYFAHFGSYWMTISPKSWLLHEELREGSKYTLPRFQITSFGEKQYFTLVGPPTGDLNNFISEKSESYFKQNILLKSYKDWGKIYYPFEIVEPFDPESIINNWDQIISEYTIKSIELMKKIEFFLPEQELLNFKK